MPPPTEPEARSTRPFMADGSIQRKKDLKTNQVEPPEGQTMGNKLSTAMLERLKLAEMQADCQYFGPMYAILSKDDSPEARKRRARAVMTSHPEMRMQGRNVSGLFVAASNYQMHNGLLYRKRYEDRTDEMQLRCCAPTGESRHIVTQVGIEPMEFRTELMME